MKKHPLPLLLSLPFLLVSCGVTPESSAQPGSQSQDPGSQPASTTSGEASNPSFDPSTVSNSFIFHYHRDDGDYKTWNLWLWPAGGKGDAYNFTYEDSYGGICVEPISTFFTAAAGSKLGIIVRTNDWAKDFEADRFIELDSYVADAKGNYEFWLYTGVEAIYSSEPKNVSYLSSCGFTSYTTLKAHAGAGKISKLALYKGDEKIQEQEYQDVDDATMTLNARPEIDSLYKVIATMDGKYEIDSSVSMIGLYEDPSFDEAYYYSGKDLGITYTPEKTTFKVWSPVAKSISVRLYDTGTPVAYGNTQHPGNDTPLRTVAMEKGDKGVWSLEIEGDLNGKYYTYVVNNYLYKDQEVVDPYAYAVGVNGLRGMILDLSSTDPEGFSSVTPHSADRKALTVYETHIADLTSSSTWGGPAEKAKLYSGFHQKNTKYTKDGKTVATGFDHIKELGVNAVQILPMFDQANDETNPEFNWGYNPLNYNAPEGVYSSDPYDGAVRIRELKELIQAYTSEGINIIMDVVYNHVNSVNGLNFDVLMPYYYFRYNDALGLSNGSGCGNETASDHSMFSKFMIDSACFWAKEYKLGGFRFDLMALHDLDTMDLLAAQVKKINPSAVIYGEPWNGGSSPLPSRRAANQDNADNFQGYGCFNDRIRDGLISGGMNSKTSKGWATADSGAVVSNADKVKRGLRGNQPSSSDPDKAVSYATCHDNYTLYDRIQAAHNNTMDDETAEKMALLAQSVVMTSQGTAFMLAGEEFLRTKGGDDNSYKSSYKVNELDYSRILDHESLFEHYKTLIEFKQSNPALHLELAEAKALAPTSSDDYSLITLDLPTKEGRTYRMAYACGVYKGEDSGTVDFSGYTLFYDTLTGTSLSNATVLAPYQVIVAYK